MSLPAMLQSERSNRCLDSGKRCCLLRRRRCASGCVRAPRELSAISCRAMANASCARYASPHCVLICISPVSVVPTCFALKSPAADSPHLLSVALPPSLPEQLSGRLFVIERKSAKVTELPALSGHPGSVPLVVLVAAGFFSFRMLVVLPRSLSALTLSVAASQLLMFELVLCGCAEYPQFSPNGKLVACAVGGDLHVITVDSSSGSGSSSEAKVRTASCTFRVLDLSLRRLLRSVTRRFVLVFLVGFEFLVRA